MPKCDLCSLWKLRVRPVDSLHEVGTILHCCYDCVASLGEGDIPEVKRRSFQFGMHPRASTQPGFNEGLLQAHAVEWFMYHMDFVAQDLHFELGPGKSRMRVEVRCTDKQMDELELLIEGWFDESGVAVPSILRPRHQMVWELPLEDCGYELDLEIRLIRRA